jgi:5-methylcytosine-specific restriction endonuclease McrBC regulatory subunit McrC
MIWQITEGEVSWLPGVNASDIPLALPAGISIHLRSGTIGMESQGIVGAIPLKNGDTIQIIPKIGMINFLRLLFKAEGRQTPLENEFDEFVKYSVTDEQNIDSLVVRQLLISLDEILRRSPLQGRRRRYREGDYVLGEIQVVKTFTNLATKRSQPVVSLVKERSRDIPENRVLTEALIKAWPLLPAESQHKYESIYYQWVKKFSRPKDVLRDLLMVDRAFAANSYRGVRDYYSRALMLAKIILGSNGISFTSQSNISGDAVLLNTADIFEKYIRSMIGKAYANKGFVVSKGGVGTQSLYTNGGFDLIPDIVISRNGVTTLIADVKYKKPTAADHYQISAYLSAYKLNRGLLLAPLFSGNSITVKEFVTWDKVVVREIYLPMSDLDATEEVLASLIERYSH